MDEISWFDIFMFIWVWDDQEWSKYKKCTKPNMSAILYLLIAMNDCFWMRDTIEAIGKYWK